jgi:hypothetical protein
MEVLDACWNAGLAVVATMCDGCKQCQGLERVGVFLKRHLPSGFMIKKLQ